MNGGGRFWVWISGGLGNQIFHYIFARYLELSSDKRVIFDDSNFFILKDAIAKNKAGETRPFDKVTHNGYELEYVFPNIKKPRLLSECYDAEKWERIVSRAKKGEIFGQQLLNDGFDIEIIMEKFNSYRRLYYSSFSKRLVPGQCYNSAVAKARGDTYFFGNWVNEGYFNAYKDIFLKELSFRPIADSRNKRYERGIKNSFSVGVHIRRGDFVRLRWSQPEAYYAGIVAELRKKHADAVFFVFSDEINWCEDNYKQLGLPKDSTVFVEGNYDHKNNYIDLQLMTMCDVLAGTGASTFSYIASLLNLKPGFYSVGVMNPSAKDLVLIHEKDEPSNKVNTIKDYVNGRKLVVWGTGYVSFIAEKKLDEAAMEIFAYTYTAFSGEGEHNGKPVIPIAALSKDEHYVFVATGAYEPTNAAYLTQRGFAEPGDYITMDSILKAHNLI